MSNRTNTMMRPAVDAVAFCRNAVGSLSRQCRRHGVTLEQWALLCMLEQHGKLCMSALADLLGCTTASITGRVDKLENVECVYRANLPGDRRVITLEITHLGRRLLAMLEGRAA